MAVKRKPTTQLQRAKGFDFRCPNDDAWYSVRLHKADEGVLRVMYLNFLEEEDDWYFSDQFESSDQIEELHKRFRRPAEQLQDSQCDQVTVGMVVLACHTFSNGELLFYDAVVDSISRSKHRSNYASEEQVCTCNFHVTWRHGPEGGKRTTVRAEDICLIQDSPVDDLSLKDFIASARKSLEERTGSLASQGNITSLNPAASSHGASPHPPNMPEFVDVNTSDGSQDHEEVGQSYEASKPQNKCGGKAPTESAPKGSTNVQRECFFFWVDNLDEDIEPPEVVKFLQRELSVSSQVVLFPNLFLDNTRSGAIYVEAKEHANRVLKLLNSDKLVVSLKGRPWVTNRKCCGILHCPMPWQEMNLDNENQDDVTQIRVLRPGSEGYEDARKMHAIFKAHCDRIEDLQLSLKSQVCDMAANGSRSRSRSSK
ncbi:hypothetical protein LUZ63_005187 [Rhynchospora breviuscula]|uniref:SAWADEE domain-containing protein n=1 Tax=Rhynchospora breviuscula TaxID=2022672 RepID=A0A9Q0HST3_9POAL|nr:hypothetical protein LUZ63_005187 [Rhynchospora breviuscula]